METDIAQTVEKSSGRISQMATDNLNRVSDFWQNHQDEIIAFGKTILLAILVLLIAWLVRGLLHRAITKFMKKYVNVDISLVHIIKKTATALVLFFAALIVLDLFGINTTSVLTVLGASALAIGLALKDTLSNVAAGIFLLTQHPYKTGDYIEAAGVAGSIQDIGLFTTQLRTPQGQDIFLPNNSILASPIINYSSNDLRRADIPIQISYSDNIDKAVQCLVAEMKKCELIVETPEPVVLVSDYKDSGVELNLRYWTRTEDYWTAIGRIKACLKDVLEAQGCTIPFPHTVLSFESAEDAKALAAPRQNA